MNGNDEKVAMSKEQWVEPFLEELHVRETAAQPGKGNDGHTTFADCTKS